MNQLTHYNTNFTKRTFPIILVCDNVTNVPNIGSLFRTADAFGIEKIIICGKIDSLSKKITKTSRSTEKYVDYEFAKSASEVVKNLKIEDYQLISLEITSSSKSIHSFKLSNSKPIALLIGDENFGISEDILQLSNDVIHIDMFGENSSMNVVQAANIALYELTKQLLNFK